MMRPGNLPAACCARYDASGMIRRRGVRLLLLGAAVGWAGCGSSTRVVTKDAAPDAPADVAGEAPGEPRPEPAPETSPDAAHDEPVADARPDVAPADAAPDRPAPPDAGI